VAAKSITVAISADDALARLDAWADAIDRTEIQNGWRLRLRRGPAAVALNVYPSKGGGCKAVFDRAEQPEADEIVALLGGVASAPSGKSLPLAPVEPVLDDATAWIGSDESGKGDYFGPLVVAAVALTRDNWRVLTEFGVRDSKSLTGAQATSLAGQIADAFPNRVIAIGPRRYNELWRDMGRNVNRVLAWAHARAIENVLEDAPDASAAVADQFGDESYIRDALFKKGRALRLVQMPRAERDPAVAAASVLARADFLSRLQALGRQYGVALPKGASPAVEAVAKSLVSARGRDVLEDVAKVHFKTTQRVV